MTRQVFGALVVVKQTGNSKDGKRQYLCKCECGQYRIVKGTDLRSGKVHNCGCIHGNKKYVNGFSLDNHSHKRIYRIWNDMKRRCLDDRREDYMRYGGRGINVCAEWLDFQNFFEWSLNNGYGDNLTIDRIDVDGGYSPQNCRWADAATQANNRTNNHYMTYLGETKTMKQWCDELGLPYYAVRARQSRGWSDHDSLSIPVQGGGAYDNQHG